MISISCLSEVARDKRTLESHPVTRRLLQYKKSFIIIQLNHCLVRRYTTSTQPLTDSLTNSCHFLWQAIQTVPLWNSPQRLWRGNIYIIGRHTYITSWSQWTLRASNVSCALCNGVQVIAKAYTFICCCLTGETRMQLWRICRVSVSSHLIMKRKKTNVTVRSVGYKNDNNCQQSPWQRLDSLSVFFIWIFEICYWRPDRLRLRDVFSLTGR